MTEKTELLEELIERNDSLENYFRNTIIPQLYIDGNMILQKFTPPAMKQFSLSLSDIGRSIYDVVENFRYPTIIENIQQVLEENQILEKEVQTTDMRWFQMNIIPYIETKTKKLNGVIITFVEITSRIRDLKDQEKLISDHETLLDTISHDIKTPLTSLMLAIEMFKGTTPDRMEEYNSVLKMVETAVHKMKDLIHELTDIRKKQHKYAAEEELLNFGHIFEDVRLTLSDDIKRTHADIRIEILTPEIVFSRRKLRSIIYNLVANAIKYSGKERPVVSIKTEQVDDCIVISIKDNGIGIPEDKLESVFKKYYRIENKLEGTGIGLYLVKEIISTAGGKITLKSEIGKGSEFCVYFPIK